MYIDPTGNEYFSAETGGEYDIFQTTIYQSGISFLDYTFVGAFNEVNNLCGFMLNSAANAYGTLREGAVWGVEKLGGDEGDVAFAELMLAAWGSGAFSELSTVRTGLALEGVASKSGVLDDAMFAQKTYNPMFSAEGKFAGSSVDDVAAALRSGNMNPSEVPISYIVRDGQEIILNTRSSQALEVAGVPRSQWNAINRTGQDLYEGLLDGQLGRNPGGPFDAVRRSGGL